MTNQVPNCILYTIPCIQSGQGSLCLVYNLDRCLVYNFLYTIDRLTACPVYNLPPVHMNIRAYMLYHFNALT